MCGRATAQSETNKPGPPRDVRAWPLVERPSHPCVWTVWLPQGQEWGEETSFVFLLPVHRAPQKGSQTLITWEPLSQGGEGPAPRESW